MSLLVILLVCAVVGYLGYVIGLYSGVNKYHKHLLEEGKIHEK